MMKSYLVLLEDGRRKIERRTQAPKGEYVILPDDIAEEHPDTIDLLEVESEGEILIKPVLNEDKKSVKMAEKAEKEAEREAKKEEREAKKDKIKGKKKSDLKNDEDVKQAIIDILDYLGLG